MLGLGYG